MTLRAVIPNAEDKFLIITNFKLMFSGIPFFTCVNLSCKQSYFNFDRLKLIKDYSFIVSLGIFTKLKLTLALNFLHLIFQVAFAVLQ